MSQRILVTGADGFIGSHLVEALVKQGHEVRALVYYNSWGSLGWLDDLSDDVRSSVEVVLGDIRDPGQMRVLTKNVETIFHLAALIGIPYSYHAPRSYVETNVGGTLNVLQAALDAGVNRVIHTSTSEVYGSAVRVPIDEFHPLQGQSPYSASKIAADQLAYSYYCSFGLPVTTLRPFNTFGPRQSVRAIIPTTILQILESEGTACVKTGDLTPTRDLTFVSDTVRGFLAAMTARGTDGEVLNLGTGYEISMGELVGCIAELMGRRLEVVKDEDRSRPAKSEVARLLSDPSKAEKMLNWTPELRGHSGLLAGLQKTITWFRENKHRYLNRGRHYSV